MAEATRLHKNDDRIVRDDLVKAWSRIKIMQINGYRTLSDALNGTHTTARMGACNKMFWSEAHRTTMNLAIDILGMEGQVLTGTTSSTTDDGPRRGRADYPVSDTQGMFFFSRSETIWGGTAEIQRNIIGERALGLPKEPKPSPV